MSLKKSTTLLLRIIFACGFLQIIDSKEHYCCPDKYSIFLTNCSNPERDTQNPINLQCDHGSYRLEIDTNSEVNYDQYSINDEGELIFEYSDSIVPYDSYCTLTHRNQSTGHETEVAFVCFESDSKTRWIYVLKGVLSLISVGFLCATLAVYFVIPSLRTTQDKVTILCIICLTFLLVLLGVLQLQNFGKSFICEGLAFITYFFIISYFAWTNMLAANVLKSCVFYSWKITEKNWFLLNNIYGWGYPIVWTIILIISHHIEFPLNPAIGEYICWIAGDKQLALYLYFPITLAILISIICFSLSCWNIQKVTNMSSEKKRRLKYKFYLYLKLFILCGLVWILEVLSFIIKKWQLYWIIFDVVNALHGVFIFLILVVFRKKVRKELGGKTVCCFKITNRWSKIENSEDMISKETSKSIKMQDAASVAV